MSLANRNSGSLSVLLVTYNHQQHIRQALDSLFAQRVDAPIELVVADDGSSDATLPMIRAYEGKDARFAFVYLDHASNRGITRNYQRGFAACHGDCVAVLEGDDYWVSPFKLQRQHDFLDAHWECDMCSANYFVYEEGRGQFTPRAPIGTGHRLLGARELIADNLVGNFSTCMYRRRALQALPHGLFDICSYDWIVNICVAQRSLIGFLEAPLSVYRLHAAGAWTKTPRIEKLKAQLELIPAYDRLTEHVFRDEFEMLAARLRHAIAAAPLQHLAKVAIEPLARRAPPLADYLPPLLFSLVHALTPPALKRRMKKILLRSAA